MRTSHNYSKEEQSPEMIDNNLSHGQISLGVNDLPVSMIIPGKLDGEQPVRHSQIIKLNQESEVGSQYNVADVPKPRDSIMSPQLHLSKKSSAK